VAKRPKKWTGFRGQQPLQTVRHPSVEQLTIAQSSKSFSGPLPSPESLAEYEQISPGFADRIVKMAEKEQVHRHEQDNLRWPAQKKLLSRGQVFGFILSLSIVGGGIWLLLENKPIYGFTTLLGAIGVVVGPFLYQLRQKRKQA
jgi:uncharacterized membrane protein